MATVKSLQDLEVWQKSRVLSNEIYSKTIEGTFAKDYGLRDQINKVCGSIMDNVAEGFERGGNKEFIQFLAYSKGSCGEVRSQLWRAKDRNHISEEEFKNLSDKALEVGKQIGGFMIYLSKSGIKGPKYIDRQNQ